MIQRNKNLIQLNKLAGYSPAIFLFTKNQIYKPKNTFVFDFFTVRMKLWH